ncbi:MAG TPA: fibronectin type III domain-containing protein, partial [Solirubrobacterales bacterium]|nr:fibronectin type III domain-containing protein [Solirubrobacterales bacterium]
EVKIWGPPITVPDAVTNPATDVQEETATLNGSVDPDGGGDVESCVFEYGTDSSYGSTVPCSPATPLATATDVSAGLSGLAASTEYHFRLVASNSNGVDSFGEDQSFITKGPPSIDSQSVENITREGAEVVGSVNPHGFSTSYIVKYVDQAQYEIDGFASADATSPVVIGSQESPQSVSQAITGLTVGTKYHYRIIATSTSGTVEGPDATFSTVPIAGVGEQYVAIEGLRSAKLQAEITPLGLETSCEVEWVTDAQFDASGYANATTVPCDPANLGDGDETLEPQVLLTGLELASTYHFRFVVENSSGTFVAPDQEFGTFGIKTFSIETLDDEGDPETRAGARPYELVSTIDLNTTKVQADDPVGRVRATGIAKDILADLPPGMIGNPEALPKCTRRVVEETNCTGDAQVGSMTVTLSGGEGTLGAGQVITRGLYNIVPPKGKPAAFASNYFNVSVNGFVEAGIRTGDDYGITAGATNIIELANVIAVEVRMWGVPADPRHDEQRECAFVKECASNAEPKPFLRNPTSCLGTQSIRAIADTWSAQGQYVSAEGTMPAVTSCNQVEFDPTIEARPTTNVTDSPSGLQVDISVPQNEDTEGIATADLKDAVVKLPAGLVVNPSGANGLAACSPSQIDLDGAGAATCPDDSKIGTVEVDTPLVDHPIEGGVYLASPNQNPFGSLLAIYIAINDPQTGVVIKLAGHVQPDPNTGQLTTTFEDNPQLPFNHFRVNFFSGPKAPLRTPPTCGTYTTGSTLTPWSAPDSGPPATPSDSYQMSQAPGGGNCPQSEGQMPNQPSFTAGTVAPIAGAYSPMNVNIERNDGSQQFSRVTITPPTGLLARLAGTTYCPESSLAAAANRPGADEKASPSCPASSRVGSVDVGAGAGPAPYYVTGQAYLAGPYKGAPLSLAIVTPAAAGPFDLGTIVTRVALKIDPATTKITAESDPIPTILQGIPLDVRSIAVKLDRPQFTKNPTSCDPKSLAGELISTLAQVVGLGNRFQVGNCTDLGFAPKLNIQLKGKTKRSGHPALQATLTMPEGSAGIARASVRLPHSEFLDQSHIGTICTRVQWAQETCPAASIYGRARAYSPLLDQPLEGPVYLRSSDNELPDMVADLRGQIDVEVSARIDSVNGGIRSTFEGVPDAPVSKFVLNMRGGKKGLLENSTDICRRKNRAVAQFDGHNGKASSSKPVLVATGCKGKKAGKKRSRAAGGK